MSHLRWSSSSIKDLGMVQNSLFLITMSKFYYAKSRQIRFSSIASCSSLNINRVMIFSRLMCFERNFSVIAFK